MCEALPVGPRPPKGRLALLLLTPLRPRRVHVAPGPTGRAHEMGTVHLHARAPLAVETVKGAARLQDMLAFADNKTRGDDVGLRSRGSSHNIPPGSSQKREKARQFLHCGAVLVRGFNLYKDLLRMSLLFL